jgi:hypothetical protein
MAVIDIEDQSDDDAAGGLGALVAEHPLALLGGALALGYVVGGGLATRASRRLLRMGVGLGFQVAALPELEDEVAGLATRLGRTLRDIAEARGGDDDFVEGSEENEQREL